MTAVTAIMPPAANASMDDITAKIDKIALIDKIDMSLDEIIKLNKQLHNDVLFNGNAPTNSFQQAKSNWILPYHKGASSLRREEMRLYRARPGQSVQNISYGIGVELFKRPLRVKNTSGHLKNFRRANFARPWDFVNNSLSSSWRHYYNGNYSETRSFRRGQKIKEQRNNRHATYVHRRGLKVQATMDFYEPKAFNSPDDPWRTCKNHSGILTVSLSNPSAVVFPSSVETRLPRPPLPFLLKKEGTEIKVPKGVPLDFDINSVAKQTGITLNERFKILKEQSLSQTVGKGSRFVTVG